MAKLSITQAGCLSKMLNDFETMYFNYFQTISLNSGFSVISEAWVWG